MTQSVEAGKERKRIPVQEGAFTIPERPDEPAHLIGGRCPECGECSFPSRTVCLNCYHRGLERAELGPHGTLSTFTIARQQSPAALVKVPYAIGQVRLDEGPVVQALLTESDPDRLHVGMEMELIVDRLGENEEGDEVITYKFRPL